MPILGDANVNNITITPQSGTINGSPGIVINVARGSVSLVKRHDNQWLYLSYAAGAGGGAQVATVVALQGQGVTAARRVSVSPALEAAKKGRSTHTQSRHT